MTEKPEDKLRATLARALRKIEVLRGQVSSLEAARSEPIAVIGMGVRLPGHVHDLSSLWRMLEGGVDTTSVMPSDRWDAEPLHDPSMSSPGKMYVREAAFVDNIDQFDAAFFNISPPEAKSMDPQHRLLLETAWEALETAGIVPRSLTGTNTSVFVGATTHDYEYLLDSEDMSSSYALLGIQTPFTAGRIAYHLGLRGPTLTVDTACSSSLVALHLAGQALRSRQSDLAIVAGVQLMSDPRAFVLLSAIRALAPDGRSKTFSARADGYGRGEGVVVLACERLSDAVAKGRDILAIVRGTAVNHDGASNGIAAPNGVAQEEVIRAALGDAGISAHEVDFIECHGTGTKLGDPIEVQALAAVYGLGRAEPLLIGAIKPNIGHLESAAGLAGVAKVIAAFRYGEIPPTIQTRPLNPFIDWENLQVQVVDARMAWPRREGRSCRAGVSSFGISGTNSHIVLEDPPKLSLVQRADARPELPAVPIVLSARSEDALRGQAARLREHLQGHPDLDAIDLGFSLATTRSHFSRRVCLISDDLLGALDELARKGRESQTAGVVEGAPVGLALLFTGQGAQRLGMGRELRGFSSFRVAFDDACTRFDALLDPPLRSVIFAEPSSVEAALLDQTAYTQPALFTLEVALFRLFESWGITPVALLGHSIGELAAAHVAGVFDLDDACKLVAARGRLMQALPEGGAMVSIQASEREVTSRLERHPDVDIAGLNGPMSTVVAGDEPSVLALAAHFEALGRKTTRLTVSHAFHSRRMDPMLDAFREEAGRVRYHAPRIPIVSNVLGRVARPEDLCSAEYWVRHVREAVRFLDGVRALESAGVEIMLELGPHGVLSSMASACLSEAAQASTVVIPSMHKQQSEGAALVAALGRLHCHGVGVDWAAFYSPYSARRVPLPTYAFQRRSYWLDSAEAGRRAARETEAWRYAIAWRALAEHVMTTRRRRWLVLTTPARAQKNLARLLVPALEAAAIEVIEVALDPHADGQPLAQTLQKAVTDIAPEFVISLFALDDSVGLLLNHALALALVDSAGSTRIWMLTQSAVATNPGEKLENPRQATAWGLGRSLSMESPDLFGGILDLPLACDAELLARVPAAISRDDYEDQLALRINGLFACRLVRASELPRRLEPPRFRGTVLITGGTGALGAHVARWAARSGAEQIVLTSRSGLAAAGAEALRDELEALGPRVTIEACDVASREAVSELFTRLHARGADPKSIIHTAGVLDDGMLAAMTPQRFARVLAPKVDATLLLHEFSRTLDLDYFVLFSSIVATFGSVGQSNYAAANAFLDAFTRYRADAGHPATVIAWGPWAEGGMATSDVVEQRTRRQGLRPMPAAKGIAALALALANGDIATSIADIDWTLFAPFYASAHPRRFLAELNEIAGSSVTSPGDRPSSALDDLRALSAEDRAERLLEIVTEQAAKMLGLRDRSAIEPRTGFIDLGFDSLMAVEFRQVLQRATGQNLPATLTFDHPSPLHVRDLLLERFDEQFGNERPGSASTSGLADEQVRAALARVDVSRLRQSGLLESVLALAESPSPAGEASSATELDELESDDLVDAVNLLLEDI